MKQRETKSVDPVKNPEKPWKIFLTLLFLVLLSLIALFFSQKFVTADSDSRSYPSKTLSIIGPVWEIDKSNPNNSSVLKNSKWSFQIDSAKTVNVFENDSLKLRRKLLRVTSDKIVEKKDSTTEALDCRENSQVCLVKDLELDSHGFNIDYKFSSDPEVLTLFRDSTALYLKRK